MGEFRALRIEAATGEARQVLVRKHPWGHAEIAIPISAVAGFAAGIQLSLTKAQVKDLAS